MAKKRKVIMATGLALVMVFVMLLPVGLRQVKAEEAESYELEFAFNQGKYNVVRMGETADFKFYLKDGKEYAVLSFFSDEMKSEAALGDYYNYNLDVEQGKLTVSVHDGEFLFVSRSNDKLVIRENTGNKELINWEGRLANVNQPYWVDDPTEEGGGGDEPQPEAGPVYDQNDPNGDSVYFVWIDGDNVYSHEIQNVKGSGATTDANYAELASITDGDVKYTLANDNFVFCWKALQNGGLIITLQDYMATDEFQQATDKVEALKEAGYAIDPAINIDDYKTSSTITTNGDRAFRLVIYNEATYEGIKFSQNEDDYTYFPSFWDPTFYTGLLDVSGTTAENPAEYNAFVLEPTIKFSMDDKSNSPITSLEALNVPLGAVMVSKVGDGFNIEFASNFFDNVVFKATSANGTYYIKINRASFNIYSEFIPGSENGSVIANFFYKDSESYNDYDVYATITKTDGTKTLQKLSPSEVIDEGGNKTGQIEIVGGKGLKQATYIVEVPRSGVSTVSFNVIKAGAMASARYGGSYAGSDNGITYDLEQRRTIY